MKGEGRGGGSEARAPCVFYRRDTSGLLVLRILEDFEPQPTTALSLLEEADGRGWDDLRRWWGRKDEQGRGRQGRWRTVALTGL